MAKKASTLVIGGFVVSAIVLLITAVLFFGSGSFWTRTETFVLYFRESVKGLTVGSPVMFQGVRIGSVKSIVLQADPDQYVVHIPVTIEVNVDTFVTKKGGHPDIRTHFDQLIERGLRGQLAMQSFVTGQLMIQLNFFPDSPVQLSGLENVSPEIPTVRSSLAKLTKTLGEIPIQEIADNLSVISKQIRNLLEGHKVDRILDNLDSATSRADRVLATVEDKAGSLVQNLDTTVAEVSPLLPEALKSLTEAAENTSNLVSELRKVVTPMSTEMVEVLDAAESALGRAESVLKSMDNLVDRSATRDKLNRSLDEISAAARALENLADYLERHPEALLRGKYQGDTP